MLSFSSPPASDFDLSSLFDTSGGRNALVAISLRPYEVQASTGPGGIAALQTIQTSLGIAPIGNGTHWRLTCGSNPALTQFAAIEFDIMGDSFGLIFNPGFGVSASIPPAPLGLLIDNVAFDLDRAASILPETLTTQTRPSGYIYQVFRRLGRGKHHVKIILSGSATQQRDVSIAGILVETAAGYQPQPRGIVFQAVAPTAIATTGTVIDPQGFTTPPITALRRIILTNSTAGAITVTPEVSTSFTAPIDVPVSVPANGSAVLHFIDPVFHPITLVASATGVTAAIGGFL